MDHKALRKEDLRGRFPLNPHHHAGEGYMRMEREQLAQRAHGKMAKMIGQVLPGESEEELDLLARDDQYLAQQGYVALRQGDKVWYEHIDELTREDMPARIEYEKTLIRWLKQRLETRKKLVSEKTSSETVRKGVPRQWLGTLPSMRRAYQTDLSDAEWSHIEPLIPAPKAPGRPRVHTLREILNAIFYT